MSDQENPGIDVGSDPSQMMVPREPTRVPPPAADVELFLANQAANGGAVGSLVLGIMAVAGSWVSPYSVINGIIGMCMGFWGLRSTKKKTAWLGIAISLLGIAFCLIPLLTDFWRTIPSSENTPME